MESNKKIRFQCSLTNVNKTISISLRDEPTSVNNFLWLFEKILLAWGLKEKELMPYFHKDEYIKKLETKIKELKQKLHQENLNKSGVFRLLRGNRD